MPALRDHQETFLRALLSVEHDHDGSALAAQPGFSVYRNTVMAGCVDALAANYPTVHQLIGADCFAGAAAAYARSTPPSSSVLAVYGDGFATFLSTFDPVVELAYLPSVATLDRCWTEANFAAAAPVLQPTDLAGLTPEALGRARLVLHPATRWRTFADMPAFTIWRRHREGLPLDDELDWRGESALLTRPADVVAWTATPCAAARFLSSCAAGQSFASAVEAAQARHGEDDDVSEDDAPWLTELVRAGAFARLEVVP